MKVIIAGSRSITDYEEVRKAIASSGLIITEVVSGTASGVDRLGEEWALKFNVPIAEFPADWKKYGKSAGYKRNEQMAEYADALIAVWDGQSKGTASMIKIANKKEMPVFVHKVIETEPTFDISEEIR